MSSISELSSEMAARVETLLGLLNPEQQRNARLEFDDEMRRQWYYTPNDRNGLALGDMTNRAQQQAAFQLLATGLSEAAYNEACVIIGLDNILARRNRFREDAYSGRGPTTRLRDPLMYFVAVFGEPGGKEPWGWSFSGHHVSVNYTIAGDYVAATPAFLGADPARAPMPGGLSLRPLAAEEDTARSLLLSLSADQRTAAVLHETAPFDIMHGNRPRLEDGAQPIIVPDMRPAYIRAEVEARAGAALAKQRQDSELTPEAKKALHFSSTRLGIAARDLKGDQQEAFAGLIRLYLDRVPPAVGAQYQSVLQGPTFNDTTFGWAGPSEVGATHYYRIQSDRLVIEYNIDGPESNHLHSVWRDLTYDFGGDILGSHYEAAHV